MVLAAIDVTDGDSLRHRIILVSERTFYDENNAPVRFTWKTIQTWYARYKKHGLTQLNNKGRSDRGKLRKVCPEQLLQAIETVRPLFHNKKLKPRLVYKACIEKGLIRADEVSQTSFYRVTKNFDLFKNEDELHNKKRLSFAKAHANELWQGDTLIGPFINVDGKMVQTKLIVFIDDASRVVPHGQFFLEENVDTLIQTLRPAIYKRGLPQHVYVDNGAIYTSKELILICARLGILLSHAPVRDGAAKGKIERFNRTVRDGFLSKNLNLDSLAILNRQFIEWLESEYNSKVHSTIGLKPIDRFGLDLNRIRFLPPDPYNDELFFMEIERSVSKTNTFQLNTLKFETPVDLRLKKISVRFDRINFDPHHIIVYYNDQRMGRARVLDLQSNDRYRNYHNF